MDVLNVRGHTTPSGPNTNTNTLAAAMNPDNQVTAKSVQFSSQNVDQDQDAMPPLMPTSPTINGSLITVTTPLNDAGSENLSIPTTSTLLAPPSQPASGKPVTSISPRSLDSPASSHFISASPAEPHNAGVPRPGYKMLRRHISRSGECCPATDHRSSIYQLAGLPLGMYPTQINGLHGARGALPNDGSSALLNSLSNENIRNHRRRNSEAKILMMSLDPDADEVKAVKSSGFTFGSISLLNQAKSIKSYNTIREAYRINRATLRKNEAAGLLVTLFLCLTDLTTWRHRFISALQSRRRIFLFYILDLFVDVLFCALYLVEIQYLAAFPVTASPRWIHTSRPRQVFLIGLGMSWYMLFSSFFRILFAESRFRTVFSWTSLIDLLVCLPFVVLFYVPDGDHYYIPYFLRACLVVNRLRRLMRVRTWFSLSMSATRERIAVLVATILVLVYIAMAFFTYFEYNFGDDTNYLDVTRALYFVFITMSTVGYGDITPHTIPSRWVVICLIVVALAVLPGLISSLVDALKLERAGGGYFEKGAHPFVVLVGVFSNAAKIKDVLTAFYDRQEDQASEYRLLFLSREEPSGTARVLLDDAQYKHKVTFLVGQALVDPFDMKRADVQSAAAVFIVADRYALDPAAEDRHNTLRVWAFDDYAPGTDLYVSNLLPQTESYQMRSATEVLCIDDLKQILLAYNAIYRGSATLLLNLIRQSEPCTFYDEPWKVQYGDGSGNEIYSSPVREAFVGHLFARISFYLYREFQVILFAVQTWIPSRHSHHLILNPGISYRFRENDQCIYIAQSPRDLDAIKSMDPERLAASLTEEDAEAPELPKRSITRRRPSSLMNDVAFTFKTFPRFSEESIVIGQPEPLYIDAKVPLCHLLRNPPKDMNGCVLEDASDMVGHFLICTKSFDMFRFVCTLRSAHLEEDETRKILFLCSRLPNKDEFTTLSQFPSIYYMAGDPSKKKCLLQAGLVGADKVIILNYSFGGNEDDFSDSKSIMISHLIYGMCREHEKKYVIIELQKRSHIKFLRPTGKRLAGKKHRRQQQAPPEDIDLGGEHLFAPMFAAGRVVAAPMLDSILYQTFHSKVLLEVFNSLCGVRYQRDIDLDRELRIDPAYLSYIDTPDEFSGRPFKDVYRELALNHGIVPLGLLRDCDDPELGNRLPFVYGNPISSLLLKSSDLIFVLMPLASGGESSTFNKPI
ncbi:hypothetical protein SeMB42_g01752 [Synchytrium endobioticum]|uniref:Ion transport domain-containing protein n=1 Tax=Synchytrium endobioticum TaxID=286115 RepID=A0A507DJY2_9FUNG|nr:hypothetical protein SeLEV6574_g04443 [Synchytrium endobioticum]TPX51954.1 hypothetical protein SeMB42_g01752 [Synchytrium endobioticum]